jgi:hypothetical protein
MNRLNSHRPVKQTRALLESNPPRDNWIDGDEITNVSTFGEANTSPNENWEIFISEPEHALKNSSKTISKCFRDGQTKTIRKNYFSGYPFFRSKPKGPGEGTRACIGKAKRNCTIWRAMFIRCC